jgi:membrane protein required for colicin V production
MPFAVLDIIVVVVVLISAVLAMVRGFVREVLSVAAWVAAVAAAYFLYGSVLPLVKPYFESNTVATIVSAAAIFFIALIVASFLTMKVADVVIDSRVGALDRSLGFLFGAARGLLLLVIAMAFFTWLVQKPPAWVATARSKPLLDTLGARLMAALPDDIEAKIQDWSHRRQEGGADAGPAADDPADADPAPSTAAKQGIDRLIRNNGAKP